MAVFIFLIHFHQPVGQLRHVMERVQRNCYEMLARMLGGLEGIRIALHFSGPLLMAWRDSYPEFLDVVRELAKRREVEILGGTFSEAALPILPEEDRLEQLVRGRRLVEELLGVRPKGAWLPERVWDPSLPRPLRRAGYEYVVLDDEVGFRAGLGEAGVHRAWLTEYSGSKVGVLFIDARVRYLLPWRSHGEVLAHIKSFPDDQYVLWGSDAEKFGEWWDPARAEEWLRGFFESIRREGVRTETPLEYIVKRGYAGLAYLPPGSYDKMMEWSGGYFPLFLTKYAESNNMHKKMLYVRRKVRESGSSEALREYLLAQCNDAYWHGLFGGAYLAPLRQAVYEHLIRAERLADERLDFRGVRVLEYDFDYDGDLEIIMESRALSAYIKPSDGGTLFELDVRLPGLEHNLVATMSRYPEPYLEGVGSYRPDWYGRVCFREHIWARWGSLRDWIENTPFFDASDLALARFLYVVGGSGVTLFATGRDWSNRERPRVVYVEKTFTVDREAARLSVSYCWRNMEREPHRLRASTELSLSPRLGDGGRVLYEVGSAVKSISEAHAAASARRVRITSEDYPPVELETSVPAEVWVAPLSTLARTERGVREVLQGLGVVFVYDIELDGGECFRYNIEVSVGD